MQRFTRGGDGATILAGLTLALQPVNQALAITKHCPQSALPNHRRSGTTWATHSRFNLRSTDGRKQHIFKRLHDGSHLAGDAYVDRA